MDNIIQWYQCAIQQQHGSLNSIYALQVPRCGNIFAAGDNLSPIEIASADRRSRPHNSVRTPRVEMGSYTVPSGK